MTGAHDHRSEADVHSVQEVVLLDLRHRLKNVYAVIGGVLSLSARAEPGLRPYVAALKDRISALEAAQAYLSDSPALTTTPTVMGFLRVLVAPFDGEERETFVISGHDAALDPGLGAPLALIVRELTTNAVKHGALSNDRGRVEIECGQESGGYAIRWRETGGPSAEAPPASEGVGAGLIERAAALVGFTVERRWRAQGLEAMIVMPDESPR